MPMQQVSLNSRYAEKYDVVRSTRTSDRAGTLSVTEVSRAMGMLVIFGETAEPLLKSEATDTLFIPVLTLEDVQIGDKIFKTTSPAELETTLPSDRLIFEIQGITEAANRQYFECQLYKE